MAFIRIHCAIEDALKRNVGKVYTTEDLHAMDPNTFINAVFVCLVNASFMVAGIILNAVVMVSLWKSSQLRKKPCYFMILVLSCFDLAVVAITHPVLILSTILWSMEIYHGEIEDTRVYTNIFLGSFSTFALLTLNIERFLALTYPFFHQSAVTKRRLVLFQAFLMTTTVSLSPLAYFYWKTTNIIVAVSVSFLLFVFICLNYKMFIIAKSKLKDESVSPTSTPTSSNQERKRRNLNFKNISTCSLAVGCFFICSWPHIIYCASRLTSKKPFYDRQVLIFSIWSVTFFSMNSTFDCLIFFWRNSILRREGMKVVKCFQLERS